MVSDKSTITDKSKKTEILEAYQELLKQLEEKQRYKTVDLPVQHEQRKQEEVLVKKTEGYSIDAVTKEMEEFKKGFSTNFEHLQERLFIALKTLTEQLKSELIKLQEIRTSIMLEEKKLQEIYGLKNAAGSLQEFLQLKEEQKRLWEEEKEAMEKMRKREEEEYLYARQLKRKKEEDEHIEQRDKIKAMFEDEMQNRQEQFTEKEKLLQSQLTELEELRKLRNQFDALKEKAIQENLTRQQKELQKDFDTKSLMENQKHTAEKGLLEQRIKTLTEQTTHFESEVITLKKELRLANDKAQELALTIIQSQKKEMKVSGENKEG